MWLSKCTQAFKNIIQLNVLTTFLLIFISKALKCHMYKFFQIASNQDSLLVKRRNDNHSPGPVIRELVPSSHQRSEPSNTILCIFSG